MSSLLNKVKDAISSDGTAKNTSATRQDGVTAHNDATATHPTDPRTRQATHEGSGTVHDGSYPRGDNYALGQEANRGFDGPAKKTDGPHKSDLMNKLDPRVDSDGDRSKNLGMNPTGDATTTSKKDTTHSHNTDSTVLPSGGVHSGRTTDTSLGQTSGIHSGRATDTGLGQTSGVHSGRGTGTGLGQTSGGGSEGTFGPHSSRLANAADPRVDSDLDSRRAHQSSTNAGLGGTNNARSSDYTPASALHGSRTANTGDPGVDSHLDSNRNEPREGGFFSGTSGTARNQGISEGEFGPHSSRAANAADPRVDSDLDSRRGNPAQTSAFGGASGTNAAAYNSGSTLRSSAGNNGPGPAPNTAGPHKSDAMNKVDPRVDSDLDNSKTYGGDKTLDSGTTRMSNRDPRDAAQVPPSVMQKHIGKPTIEHDDATHDRSRRHSRDKNESHHGL